MVDNYAIQMSIFVEIKHNVQYLFANEFCGLFRLLGLKQGFVFGLED